jgi:hypothetical protein
MTDNELEQRLRAWYQAEIDPAEPAPLSLRTSVAAIPRSPSARAGRFGTRRGVMLLAAATLLAAGAIGGVLVVGSGLVRQSSLVPPSSPGASLAVTLTAPASTEGSPLPTSSGSTPAPSPTLVPTTEPTPSPSGLGLMAVYQFHDTTADIFTLDPVSGQRTALGSVPLDSVQLRSGVGRVVWSVDHSRITVLRLGDGAQVQAQIDVAQHTLTPLSLRPTGQQGDEVSPVGDRLAGPDGDVPDGYNLRVVDLQGTELVRRPLPTGFVAFGGAAWAPDGTAVLVSGAKTTHAHLLIVPLDGGPIRQLGDSTVSEFGLPRWSPDMSTIAVAIECTGTCIPGIGTVDVATGDVTQLTTVSGDVYPTWSPDGQRIAFVRTSKTGSGIWVMDADGGNLTKLTTALSRAGDFAPIWSPDGTSILFSRGAQGVGLGDLWLVPSTGGEPQLLLQNAVADW